MTRDRVVVLGSLHYDITVATQNWPSLGETAVGSAWAPKLGGKGRNQAVAAARAGAATEMIGAVGVDQFGTELVNDLDAQGVAHERVRATFAAGSGMSVALFEPGGDYRAVIVSGANLTLDADDIPPAPFWDDVAVLVLQNEVPDAANAAAARAARAAGVRVLLNAAPARALGVDLVAHVDLLVVNAVEAATLTGGAEPHALDDAMAAARALARQFAGVVVTVGGAGLAYVGKELSLTVAGEKVTVVNTHGAGDAFVGSLAARLAAGDPVEVALRAANHAAAVLVATPEERR